MIPAAVAGGPPTELGPALEGVDVPAFLVDDRLRVTWANAASKRLLGDLVGRSVLDAFAPEARRSAEEAIAAKLVGREHTRYESTLLDAQGRRIPVEISSVALREGGRLIGIFGLVTPPGRFEPKPPPAQEPRLTPRQHDVLRLLGHGHTTAQMAEILGLQEETVRNHVRGLLRRLGQRSRLAAVAHARRHGLL